MKVNACTNVAQKSSPITNNNQAYEYRALINKLVQPEPNHWPKFQEQLKN